MHVCVCVCVQVMVAMMENQMLRGALDLTRLTFYCQQPAAALAVLADVAAQAADLYRSSAGAWEQGRRGRAAGAGAGCRGGCRTAG